MVEIETEASRVIWYAMLIFMLPIVASLVGYFIGNALLNNSKISLLFAFATMACVFVCVAIYSKLTVEKRSDAVIVRIIKKSNI